MRATGSGGVLRYGYQRAARLGPWVIASDGAAFRFTAPLVDVDAYWLAQRPLHLVLALGQVEWIWEDVAPTVDGGTVTVLLTRRPDVAGVRGADEKKEHKAS